MRFVKKLIYYSDVKLLLRIFIVSAKITFSLIKKNQSPLALIPPVNKHAAGHADKNKINKYVNLCIFIRRGLGFSDACLMYSTLLCYMLREAGVEAKINFGAKKTAPGSITGLNSIGHCWVTLGAEEHNMPYELIFKHP